jgi:hypothetical protein
VPDPDLAGEQDVLAGLRHHAVERGHHEDRAVDLGRAGDHVLHVVRVARHVHVRVVPRGRLVLDVRDVDGDAAHDLLGRAVDPLERHVRGRPLAGEELGDRGRQGGLAVVDVPHRADVEVGLGARKGLLEHVPSSGASQQAGETRRPSRPFPRGASRPPVVGRGRRAGEGSASLAA